MKIIIRYTFRKWNVDKQEKEIGVAIRNSCFEIDKKTSIAQLSCSIYEVLLIWELMRVFSTKFFKIFQTAIFEQNCFLKWKKSSIIEIRRALTLAVSFFQLSQCSNSKNNEKTSFLQKLWCKRTLQFGFLYLNLNY